MNITDLDFSASNGTTHHPYGRLSTATQQPSIDNPRRDPNQPSPNRQRFIQTMLLVLITAASYVLPMDAQSNFVSPTKIVWTTQGLLQGLSNGKVDVFLGLPYAAPPIGDLRWRGPAEASRWSGVREADREASECAQSSSGGSVIVSGSEDCLYLNIFRPAGTQLGEFLPVLMFIPGGGNLQGTGNELNPSAFAAKTKTIVVMINYRLNVFGFLALPSLDVEAGEPSSGNYGLLDQQAAMRWIRRNILGFGGDPFNITIAGESAGAKDVCANLVSPTASGLFGKAIMESGYCPKTSHTEAIRSSTPVAAALGCTDPQTQAECMRGATVAQLLTAAGPPSLNPKRGSFQASPNYGNSIMPLKPSDALSSGQWNQSSILIGSNHDEMSGFVDSALRGHGVQFPFTGTDYETFVKKEFGSFANNVMQQYPLADYGDAFLAFADENTDFSVLGCPVTQLSQSFAGLAPTFRYEFNDQTAPGSPQENPLGAYHAAELQYLYQNATLLNPAQEQLSDQMMQYWANFARMGSPNGPGLLAWPNYDAATHELLSFQTGGNTVIDNFDVDHHCAFWAGLRTSAP